MLLQLQLQRQDAVQAADLVPAGDRQALYFISRRPHVDAWASTSHQGLATNYRDRDSTVRRTDQLPQIALTLLIAQQADAICAQGGRPLDRAT